MSRGLAAGCQGYLGLFSLFPLQCGSLLPNDEKNFRAFLYCRVALRAATQKYSVSKTHPSHCTATAFHLPGREAWSKSSGSKSFKSFHLRRTYSHNLLKYYKKLTGRSQEYVHYIASATALIERWQIYWEIKPITMNISGSCLSNEKSITQEGVKHTAAQLKRCPHVNGYSKGYVDMEHLSLTYYRWMESLWHFGLALSKTTYRQRLYLNGHSARPQKQLDRHVNQKLLIKCFFFGNLRNTHTSSY